jgi:sortase A
MGGCASLKQAVSAQALAALRSMIRRIFNLKRAETALLLAGLVMLFCAGFTYVNGLISARAATQRFHAAMMAPQPVGQGRLKSITQVDYSLWSTKRTEQYKASLAQQFNDPVALLRVPKIRLEVPVFEGTDDRVLNRGVGLIEGTARVDQSGNVGIAGHRDGFFRGLKDVQLGDPIELETAEGVRTYVTDSITIVDPHDVSVLRGGAESALTLVTCYPFYVLGSAPQRYIVHASLHGEIKR